LNKNAKRRRQNKEKIAAQVMIVSPKLEKLNKRILPNRKKSSNRKPLFHSDGIENYVDGQVD
jgi:hypothetical protein